MNSSPMQNRNLNMQSSSHPTRSPLSSIGLMPSCLATDCHGVTMTTLMATSWMTVRSRKQSERANSTFIILYFICVFLEEFFAICCGLVIMMHLLPAAYISTFRSSVSGAIALRSVITVCFSCLHLRNPSLFCDSLLNWFITMKSHASLIWNWRIF